MPTHIEIDISPKMPAPPLTGGTDWFNVTRAVSLDDLRGKIVVLDFWTYCCINCLHVLPALQRLDAKYRREVAIIGVHAGKFENEKESENIRQAILRLDITHPVVNDAHFAIWRRYHARGWPHVALIDPLGNLIGLLSGESVFEVLDAHIAALLDAHRDAIDRSELPISLERDKRPATQLAFPSKVLAENGRLFVADTNHHRILVADLTGKVRHLIGRGTAGKTDGDAATAEFFRPQGMALVGEWLYVADTGNHLIRRVHLGMGTHSVETVAGTGNQVWQLTGGPARETPLNSPWDVVVAPKSDALIVAMAGPHQLWRFDPQTNEIAPFSGSGIEGIADGPLLSATHAQPSGLSSDGQNNLYVADSEGSALRVVELTADPPRVTTLVGKEGAADALFHFGDTDGHFANAKLQHPLGVAWHNDLLYVADTYNHKIKVADLRNRQLSTFAGNGQPGIGTVNFPQFYEPGGLSIAGTTLFVADTNNHAIRAIDLTTHRTTTLPLDFSDVGEPGETLEFSVVGVPLRPDLRGQKLAMGSSLVVTLALADELHLNPRAKPTAQVRLHMGSGGPPRIGPRFVPEIIGETLRVQLDPATIGQPGADHERLIRIDVAVTVYYCRHDDEGPCSIRTILIESPAADSPRDAAVRAPIRD